MPQVPNLVQPRPARVQLQCCAGGISIQSLLGWRRSGAAPGRQSARCLRVWRYPWITGFIRQFQAGHNGAAARRKIEQFLSATPRGETSWVLSFTEALSICVAAADSAREVVDPAESPG